MDWVIWFKARRRAARLVNDALRTIQSAQINNHATEKETERFFAFASRRRTEWYKLRP
jgi:hypothetical protein